MRVLLTPLSWLHFLASSKPMKPDLSASSKSQMISEPLPNSIAYTKEIAPYLIVISTPAMLSSEVEVNLKPSRSPASALERDTPTTLAST